MDGGNRRRPAGSAGEVRGDPPANAHLGSGHVAVKIHAPWHHHQPAGLDPAEAGGVGGAGDDRAPLDPDVVDDTVAAGRRIMDGALREHEPVDRVAGHDPASPAPWIASR